MADQSRLEIAIDSRGAETNVKNVRSELGKLERAGDTAARSADDVGRSFEDVARSAGMYRDASGRLRQANGRFASSAQQAEIRARSLGRALDSNSGGFRSIARSSQLAVPPVSNLTSLLGGLSAALVTREVIGYSDAWQNAANQLRQVTDTSDELAGTQERLMQVANDTRSDFGSTANLYSRLARSTTELGLSQSDLIGLTRTINQSFAVSGATADEAAAAITQLSQGLAAGALRGDEFNSVSEQAPGIMRAIAESLDMTIGDLRDFAAEGGITAEIVVNALQGSADAIENDFGRAVATFGQQMTVARNNMLQFVGSSDTVEGAVGNIGEAVVGLSENLDELGQAATVVAGLLAGRLAGRFVTLAAGMTSAAGAAGLLRGALAFLGGPVGILVGAGGLLYAFREELGLIPEPARSVAAQVDEISSSMEGLSNAMLDVQVAAFGAELVQIELQAQRLQTRIESLKATANDSTSFGQGQQGDLSEGIARAEAEQQDLNNRAEAIRESVEGLERFRSASDEAGEASEKASNSLTQLGDTAESVVAKFRPMLDQDIQDILDRAGPGSTIDEGGQIRDAWGNAIPTLQRELDAQLKDQLNAFKSEQNLQAGLQAAAQAFIGEAENAAKNAFSSIIPTGDQDSVPGRAGAANSGSFSSIVPMSAEEVARRQASGGSDGAPGLIPTKSQSSVPERAGKPMGSFTIRVQKEGGEDTEGTVQGDEDFIRRMASALGGAASAV